MSDTDRRTSPWSVTSAPEKQALSVSGAIGLAAAALDEIPVLMVLGEVTGFRGPNARSGHCYFQVKDAQAAMDCIIWKGTYAHRQVDLRDGMQVILTGSFNIYKPTGKMSFVARSFTLAGEGLLRQQVAELANKLRREGLMDEALKRKIPVFCTRVAVVTSLSGAVIDDVKRTLRRRNPLVELICVGSKVQGEGAPQELTQALGRAAAITPAPDCILLVRGGGSFEDLMTFNDEALARAVRACPLPVVTGIGHEPDTSICDMVSDRRCSTPTAAAESVAPAMSDLIDMLLQREARLQKSFTSLMQGTSVEATHQAERLNRAMQARLQRVESALGALSSRPALAQPTRRLERRAAELAQTADRLVRAMTTLLDRARRALEASATSAVLMRPEASLERQKSAVAHLEQRLRTASSTITAQCASQLQQTGEHLYQLGTNALNARAHALDLQRAALISRADQLTADHEARLQAAAAKLDALSPVAVLARGYSLTYIEGQLATTAAGVRPGSELRVRMSDGNVFGQVVRVEPSSQTA